MITANEVRKMMANNVVLKKALAIIEEKIVSEARKNNCSTNILLEADTYATVKDDIYNILIELGFTVTPFGTWTDDMYGDLIKFTVSWNK